MDAADAEREHQARLKELSRSITEAPDTNSLIAAVRELDEYLVAVRAKARGAGDGR